MNNVFKSQFSSMALARFTFCEGLVLYAVAIKEYCQETADEY
jgi:hypothetical protein